jgi:hypothetical protein
VAKERTAAQWEALKESTRKRYTGKGITQADYMSGRSLSAARGHAATPEHPERALKRPSLYSGYLAERRRRPYEYLDYWKGRWPGQVHMGPPPSPAPGWVNKPLTGMREADEYRGAIGPNYLNIYIDPRNHVVAQIDRGRRTGGVWHSLSRTA